MASNAGNSGDHRLDLNKHPDHADATSTDPTPVNPRPAQPAYPSPTADQFAPYTPPQYGDPLQTPYPEPQHPAPQYPAPQHPGPQYPAHHYPAQHYPAPPMSGPPPVRLQPAAVAATRTLGAVALVGALLFIAYGWLTWASFTPKYTDAAEVSVNGWGQVFQDGSRTVLDPGTTGTPYAGFFIPLFTVPVTILALLIMCNIGRFGNSIAILVLSALNLFVALIFLAVPSTCIVFDEDVDSTLFEGLNDFSTGPGTIAATATLVIVTGTSIAGIVLGRKKINPSPQTVPGYGGYTGY